MKDYNLYGEFLFAYLYKNHEFYSLRYIISIQFTETC